MTFSRHYAKARKAVLKQRQQQEPQTSPPSRQAERITVPETVSFKERAINMGRWLIRCLIALLCVAALGLAWYERAELTIPITHINVQGQTQRIDPRALQQMLASVTAKSMLANLRPLLQQLQSLPWVQSVDIKRQWPNTLVITLHEMTPIARFNDSWVLTQDGHVLVPPSHMGLAQLPWLMGPADQVATVWQAYQAMSAVLNPLGLSIWQLHLSPRFSYDIVLNNGMTLYLGSSQVMQRLQLFTRVYAQHLADKANQIDHVDLRYASSMAIGWKAAAPSAATSVPHA